MSPATSESTLLRPLLPPEDQLSSACSGAERGVRVGGANAAAKFPLSERLSHQLRGGKSAGPAHSGHLPATQTLAAKAPRHRGWASPQSASNRGRSTGSVWAPGIRAPFCPRWAHPGCLQHPVMLLGARPLLRLAPCWSPRAGFSRRMKTVLGQPQPRPELHSLAIAHPEPNRLRPRPSHTLVLLFFGGMK